MSKVVWFCRWDEISKVDGKHVYVVTHKNKSAEVVAKYTVFYLTFMVFVGLLVVFLTLIFALFCFQCYKFFWLYDVGGAG